MSPLVGVWGRGDFWPGVLLSGGSFARGTIPGGLLAGGTFGWGHFWPGGFCPGGLLPGGTFVRGLMPVPPKFNAYTHRLGFLCLAS